MTGRYRITDDSDGSGPELGREDKYDRACAFARKLSDAGMRVRVAMANKSGRVLAIYEKGREKFYTYNGGREFGP